MTFGFCLASFASVLLVVNSEAETYSPLLSNRYQPLPVEDTTKCAQSSACDPRLKYRSIDGSCSNLHHPSWGQANTPLVRTVPARYSDGKSQFRRSVSGELLPKARMLSSFFFPDRYLPSDINTKNLMQFGQLIAHDFSNFKNRQSEFSCCTTKNHLPTETLPDACIPIEVSPFDNFYSQFDVTCLSLVRAGTTENGTCFKYPIQQVNTITHVIDASMVYGSDIETARLLRSYSGGKLRVQETEDGRHFPPNLKDTSTCLNPPTEDICYFAGDDRSNQNTLLTVYQILLLRLHNYLCDEMHNINPHWDDEMLYQEVRRILGAILQHLTYKHLLPVILGSEYMRIKGLTTDCNNCCINYYNPEIRPSTFIEHVTAAFRSFHSLVPRDVIFYNEQLKPFGSILLDDYYFRPTIIQKPTIFDGLLRGMAIQPQQNQDMYISVTLTNYFFKGNKSFGLDLESIDIMRGRDMGLVTYNEMRSLCGRKKAICFDDFKDVMKEKSITKVRSVYSSVDDVDLFIGGMMEELISGTFVGPTFQCIIGEQFYHYMRGDRFYYENCGLPTSFTKEQLNAIYQTSLAWMFCTAGDDIKSIQYDTFRIPSNQNPVVSCSEIPSLDLNPWKE